MMSLLNKAFERSLSYPDKITYMTSVRYLQSIHSENTQAVVQKITDLLISKNTRLQGLQFLEIALQQNPDIYLKTRWTASLYEIIKEPVSSILKEHVCKIFCMLIPCMVKDAAANELELQKFASHLFPYLLTQVENNVEWVESAGMCLSACLKCFPQALEPHRDRLLKVLFKQISHSVSPKTFEVFAECFCYVPCCLRQDDPNVYSETWTNHYLTTLNTMHYMLNTFLTFLTEDPYSDTSVPDIGVFPFVHEEVDENIYPAYLKGVRRFLNLSRCLAKMLSTKSKFAVQVPIKLTLECISRLFQVQDMAKISSTTVEMQIVVSTLSQMQIASLVVLESLMLNFNLVPYSFLISEMMIYALQSSNLSNISSEPISPLRQAVWTLLDQWVSLHGAKVSLELVSEQSTIFEELLRDISIQTSASQTSLLDRSHAHSSKSKKNMALNSERKTFVNKSQQAVCKKALKTLEDLLYSGANFISNKSLQEIFTKVVQIAYAITPRDEFPFPYDDHMCRKLLHSVLLATAVVTKIDQRDPIQFAVGIFKKALSDPSTKVVRLCHKAMAMCRLYLHPKKPTPPVKEYVAKVRKSAEVLAEARFTEWATDDYVQNLPPVESVSNVSESTSPRIVQSYTNPSEGEITPEEYMQQDAHYSEQVSEGQCNGEDILEMQNSSQCQDEDSDEEEDDDEDEEQSYGDEEMNQDVEMQDHLYIPSTSKIQVVNSVPVVSDTEQNSEAQDYEELRPCGKSEDKSSNLNGVGNNVVIEEEVSSPSIQNVTSENGIYDGYDEEDLEEEEGDEEDEEEGPMYPGEKRIPEYLEAPASKKQKIEEVKEEPPKEIERSRSPTLEEMKADFVCEIDNVKS